MLTPHHHRQKDDALEQLLHSIKTATDGGGELQKVYFCTGPMMSEGAWPQGMLAVVGAKQRRRGKKGEQLRYYIPKMNENRKKPCRECLC